LKQKEEAEKRDHKKIGKFYPELRQPPARLAPDFLKLPAWP
jgi:hypothetical protein